MADLEKINGKYEYSKLEQPSGKKQKWNQSQRNTEIAYGKATGFVLFFRTGADISPSWNFRENCGVFISEFRVSLSLSIVLSFIVW